MRRAALAAVFALAGCMQGSFSSAPGERLVPSAAAGPSSKIRHVVIIFQENRSVDNLFNGLAGADTVRSGLNAQGRRVALAPISLTAPYDLSHTHQGFEVDYAGGKLDGFSKARSRCYSVGICIPHDVRAYGYVPRSEAAPYFAMAQQYGFGDRMFQTNQGPSFPAHQYIVSGTSSIGSGSSLRASENPFTSNGAPTGGCDSPAGSLVPLIDAAGKENQNVYPCFDRIALMDLLDAQSLSWRYYQSFIGPGIWNAPDAILRLHEKPEYAGDVVAPPSQVLTDIANGKLADVVWVTPTALESDHAKANNGSGPSWVAAVVNAIGQSSYWDDTAIFITWDDWGGWYDHVKPPLYNSYELGFRVPLVVVSPYAKNHYVSHVQHEFGSILKFVEKTFGLGSLHTTDERADDLSDFFDFAKSPHKFVKIRAPYSARYFLERPISRESPDDDSLDAPDAGSYDSLYSFGTKSGDGQGPLAHLENASGLLYGTTQYGGGGTQQCALGCGTIFRVSASGAQRVLDRFAGGSDGAQPAAGLLSYQGALYGTTSAGGGGSNCAGGCGTVFAATAAAGSERAIHAFTNVPDGAGPVAGLIAVKGTLYGTTQFGGKNGTACFAGCGTVYAITPGGSERVVYRFKGGRDGAQPVAGLIDVDGTLYGTTQYGGATTSFCANGCGTVFRIAADGSESVVYRFNYTPRDRDGAYPAARLLSSNGTFYGTTLGGGASSKGTLFKIDSSGAEHLVHSFSCCSKGTDGTYPVTGVISLKNVLYGTTRYGGASNKGAIYAVTALGAESLLYSFGDRPDGSDPEGSLLDANGVLYGTTRYGGRFGEGSVFTFAIAAPNGT